MDRTRPFRCAVAAASLVSWLLSADDANAQNDANALMHQGTELLRTGQNVEALAILERALALARTPRALAQVALAEQALGFWIEAERDLGAALIEGQDPWFEQNGPALRSALEDLHGRLASVDIQSNVAGAEVRVNGVLVGATPVDRPVRVVAGTVSIEVRAMHYQTLKVDVRADPSSLVHEEVQLLPEHALAAPPQDACHASIAPPEPTLAGVGPAPWVALGGGVLFLATAGIAWIIRDSEAAIYDDNARCFYGGLTRDQRCGGYKTAGSAAQAVSIASLGLAVGSLVASGVLFARSPHPRAQRSSTLQCTVGLMVGCQGVF